ncbi:MAG TPA: hypothetical protein VF380_03985 [Solirubrobacteraceae bacterium]
MRAALRTTAALFLLCLAAAPGAAAQPAPLYGITIDRITRLPVTLAGLAALPRRPTTRVYFDAREPASYYAQALPQIHAVGGVLGELLDSSDEHSVSVAAYGERVESYVRTLSASVDIWEIGNEVNGNWTGPYEAVAARIGEAYDIVHAAGGRTALTLYANNFGPENCGDGTSELTPAQFSSSYVPARVATGLDYVLLSYYPTQCGNREPSSAQVAQYLEELHAIYPNARLGIGEVGLPRPASKSAAAKAKQIMQWAYALAPGVPYYAGGYFWWYGAQDVLRPRAPLREALPSAFEAEAAALAAPGRTGI